MRLNISIVIIGLAFLALAGNFQGCATSPKSGIAPESKGLDHVIAAMTLEEKVGQMFMPKFDAQFYNDHHREFEEISRWVTDYHIGGLMILGGDIYAAVRDIERFQNLADTPLLIASDFEWGVPMRLSAGTRYPENMGIAATGKSRYAYRQGVITAREARSLGVHMTFSPVMDVNNNPDNPIINVRSYGQDPERVGKFGAQYIRGVQSGRVVATAKHFPGHGDTDIDSHLLLPEINADRERLDSLELVPFQAAIDAGVKAVMTSHLLLPKLPSGNTPATFSQYIVTDMLRDSLGFEGVVITDAMNMGGIVNGYWPGEAAVKAVQAGNDIILFTPEFKLAYHAVVEAVRDGRIPEQQINSSVRRILELKEWAQAGENRFSDPGEIEETVEDRPHLHEAAQIFRESITLVRDSNKVVPLDAGRIDRIATIRLTDNLRYGYPGRTFSDNITDRVEYNHVLHIGPQASDSVLAHAREVIKNVDAVVVGVFVRFASYKGTINLPKRLATFLTGVLETQKPIVTVGFGTPYLLRFFPEARTYMVTYSTSHESQRSAAAAIFGEQPISGKLPVRLTAGYEAGHGLEREIYTNVWEDSLQPNRFETLFDLIRKGISDSVAPGMAVYAAREGKVLAARGFGNYTYSTFSSPVNRETIFDLASLTKVIATTPLAMRFYEQDLLHLEKQVKAYIPGFSGGMKDSVTVRHLLTHTSGLKPYVRFWESADDPSQVIDMIVESELVYTPGDSSAYSDLGIILLGHILEKLGRNSLDTLSQKHLFTPLGMMTTQFNPPEEMHHRIPPTEYDDSYRGRQLQGEVHDENAAFLGGVAGHAGLFSTVDDLGRYAQMLLSNGYYDGRKYIQRSTIQKFTSRAGLVKGSTRALGWDTPSHKGSLYGDYFSPEAFGHTGFTGTSIIIDPEYDIIVILLTNRVYAGRENQRIREFRPKFHNAAMEALLTPEELETERNR